MRRRAKRRIRAALSVESRQAAVSAATEAVSDRPEAAGTADADEGGCRPLTPPPQVATDSEIGTGVAGGGVSFSGPDDSLKCTVNKSRKRGRPKQNESKIDQCQVAVQSKHHKQKKQKWKHQKMSKQQQQQQQQQPSSKATSSGELRIILPKPTSSKISFLDEDASTMSNADPVGSIPITCGYNEGRMHLANLSVVAGERCKTKCIQFNDKWWTPSEFQMISGRGAAKDWKRTIRHGGKCLKALIDTGVLILSTSNRHTCLCSECTDKDAANDPGASIENTVDGKTFVHLAKESETNSNEGAVGAKSRKRQNDKSVETGANVVRNSTEHVSMGTCGIAKKKKYTDTAAASAAGGDDGNVFRAKKEGKKGKHLKINIASNIADAGSYYGSDAKLPSDNETISEPPPEIGGKIWKVLKKKRGRRKKLVCVSAVKLTKPEVEHKKPDIETGLAEISDNGSSTTSLLLDQPEPVISDENEKSMEIREPPTRMLDYTNNNVENDVTGQPEVSPDEAVQSGIPHDDVSQDIIRHDDVSEDEATLDDVSKDDVVQHGISRVDVMQQEVSQDDAMLDDVSSDDVMQKDVLLDDAMPCDVSKDDVTHCDVSKDVEKIDVHQDDVTLPLKNEEELMTSSELRTMDAPPQPPSQTTDAMLPAGIAPEEDASSVQLQPPKDAGLLPSIDVIPDDKKDAASVAEKTSSSETCEDDVTKSKLAHISAVIAELKQKKLSRTSKMKSEVKPVIRQSGSHTETNPDKINQPEARSETSLRGDESKSATSSKFAPKADNAFLISELVGRADNGAGSCLASLLPAAAGRAAGNEDKRSSKSIHGRVSESKGHLENKKYSFDDKIRSFVSDAYGMTSDAGRTVLRTASSVEPANKDSRSVSWKHADAYGSGKTGQGSDVMKKIKSDPSENSAVKPSGTVKPEFPHESKPQPSLSSIYGVNSPTSFPNSLPFQSPLSMYSPYLFMGFPLHPLLSSFQQSIAAAAAAASSTSQASKDDHRQHHGTSSQHQQPQHSQHLQPGQQQHQLQQLQQQQQQQPRKRRSRVASRRSLPAARSSFDSPLSPTSNPFPNFNTSSLRFPPNVSRPSLDLNLASRGGAWSNPFGTSVTAAVAAAASAAAAASRASSSSRPLPSSRVSPIASYKRNPSDHHSSKHRTSSTVGGASSASSRHGQGQGQGQGHSSASYSLPSVDRSSKTLPGKFDSIYSNGDNNRPDEILDLSKK